MCRFLDGDLDPLVGSTKSSPTKRSLSEPIKSPTSKLSKVSSNEFQASTCSNISKEDEITCRLSKQIDEAVGTCFQGGIFSSTVQLPKAIVKTVKPQVKKKVGEPPQEKKAGEAVQDLKYTCNISFQIVAAVRRALLKEKGSDQSALLADLSQNSVAEKLAMTMNRIGELVGFEVKACNGHLNFYSATSQTTQNHTSIYAPEQVPGKSKQSYVNINNASVTGRG
jgi:arginyl-tRNA---protein transferase